MIPALSISIATYLIILAGRFEILLFQIAK